MGYSIEDREKLVKAMFNIFDVLGIDSLIDVVENKNLIFKVINETKEFDEDTVKMLKSFIKVIFNALADFTKEEIKVIFVKKK